jgi:hypothetical protein
VRIPILILGVLAFLGMSMPALGQSVEERLKKLEEAMKEQREHYEGRIDDLEREIRELKDLKGESELDMLLREAEAEAEAAEAAGLTTIAADSPYTGQTWLNAFNPRITVFGDFVWRMDSRKVYSTHSHGDEHGGHDEHDEHDEHEEGEEHEDHDEHGEHDEHENGEEHDEHDEHEEGEEHEDHDEHGHEGHEEEMGDRIDDRATLRSLELDLRADIDPFAKAVAIIALHEHEPGEYAVDVEEAYVTLETLPWGLRAKIGRYLASMGVLNMMHPHDFPQTTTPLVVENYLGDHGLISSGAELSWLVPQTVIDSTELTLGIMSEDQHILADGKSHDPAYLGRLQLFQTTSDTTWVQIGTSHLVGQTDDTGKNLARLHGIDFLARWRSKDSPLDNSLMVHSELYWNRRQLDDGSTDGFGAFALAQYQPIRNLYAGVRYDYVQPLEDPDGKEQALGFWLTAYTSEFLRFRVGYEHRWYEEEDDLSTLWFQMTFVFGSHPVEPYWFNR